MLLQNISEYLERILFIINFDGHINNFSIEAALSEEF